jgi:hypothetical protein
VSGYEEVLDRARALVDGAERFLFLSIWRREAMALGEALERAAARGVQLITFSFCSLNALPGRVYSYGIEEHELEAFWQHKLILVADHGRSLMGRSEPAGAAAVITGHPAITEVAINNIALDITLFSQRKNLDVTESMVEMLGDRLGPLDPLVAKTKR